MILAELSNRLTFSAAGKMRLVRQTEASECGLACIAMIAGFHGYSIDLNTLRQTHPISLKGATLKDIIEIAAEMDFSSRALKVHLDKLQNLQMPCILHWNLNHFVVLKSATKDSFVVLDPAIGERKYTKAEVSDKFTGIALELRTAKGFEKRDVCFSMRLTDLWETITGLNRALIQVLVLSVIVQLFVLSAPFYMQIVVDDVLLTYDMDLLLVLALGFGGFVLINEAAKALRSYVILNVGNTLNFHFVSNLFGHLVRLPLTWFEKRHVGDVLSRFSSTQPIREFIAEGLVAAFIDSTLAITTLIVVFVYSGELGAIVFFTVLAYLSLRITLYKPLYRQSEEQIATAALEQSSFIESVRGIQSIKIFGKEAERQSLWANRYAEFINANITLGKLTIGYRTAQGILFGLENVVVIYVAALLIVDAKFTIGMLFAFMTYKRHFTERSQSVIERFIEFRLLKLHLERISDIALAPAAKFHGTQLANADQGEIFNGNRDIDIDNVSFRYAAKESWVLRGLSLTIPDREMVTFVGPSGSGKTTLMKLLLALLEPTRGSVRYDGIALPHYQSKQYRSLIGAVMQGDSLLSGSIAQNISFFDTNQDFDEIQRCAELAAIHSDIARMPMGYNSLIGDMGDALSAGQRQRILFARALYRNPKILIFDEGTANLDPATEQTIVNTIRNLDITRICVAHREPLARASDRVFELQNENTVSTVRL